MSDTVIHIVHHRATPTMMSEILHALGSYVKLAVDVRREVLAGSGELHADCEQVLLRMAAARKTSGVPIGCPLVKRYNSRR